MAGTSKTTTDHDEIKGWVEARQGKPATVQRTESGDEPGVLRIDFPGYSGAGSLVEISWEVFFEKFDEKNLAFLYQDTTSSGEQSRFFKFVTRDTAEQKAESKSHKSATETEHKKEASHTSHASTKAESKAHKDDEKSHTSGHKTDSKSSKSEHKTDDKEHKAASKSHKS